MGLLFSSSPRPQVNWGVVFSPAPCHLVAEVTEMLHNFVDGIGFWDALFFLGGGGGHQLLERTLLQGIRYFSLGFLNQSKIVCVAGRKAGGASLLPERN